MASAAGNLPGGGASKPRLSVIYRSLNEEKWIGASLDACRKQRLDDGVSVELVLVDSGSTDGTIAIAERFGCRIVHIRKSEFTFGRSLNLGCEASTGDHLVFISAHCIPAHDRWLANLSAPLATGAADYAYGKQIGHDVTRYSEHQVFAHYFGDHDIIPQPELFVNNANAMIRRGAWEKYRFDESVTGLEDMVLGKALMRDGGKIAYVADAPVLHIHEETLSQIKRRYYREALTLREVFPEVHFDFGDFLRCFAAGVFHDFSEALNDKRFVNEAPGIVAFRFMQYWGAWSGHNEHRSLSRAQKESYYYPRSRRARKKADDSRRGAPASEKPAE